MENGGGGGEVQKVRQSKRGHNIQKISFHDYSLYRSQRNAIQAIKI